MHACVLQAVEETLCRNIVPEMLCVRNTSILGLWESMQGILTARLELQKNRGKVGLDEKFVVGLYGCHRKSGEKLPLELLEKAGNTGETMSRNRAIWPYPRYSLTCCEMSCNRAQANERLTPCCHGS